MKILWKEFSNKVAERKAIVKKDGFTPVSTQVTARVEMPEGYVTPPQKEEETDTRKTYGRGIFTITI
ncbi:MAG: hypothetical protein WAV41_00935 [Microgenomates group bacterium]